jgi:acylphosphatase
MSGGPKRAHLLVSGRVQGVFFRSSAARTARRLGLSGWVRNLFDGRVEAVFEGDERAVAQAVDWARTGPEGAHVVDVSVEWTEPAGDADFEIR